MKEKKLTQKKWGEYCEELYGKKDVDDTRDSRHGSVINEKNMPDLLKKEIMEAINHFRVNKAPGTDEIPAELIKALDVDGMDSS